MYKHILVAVDESEMARTLVDEAVAIGTGSSQECFLTVFHVATDNSVYPAPIPVAGLANGSTSGYAVTGMVGGFVPPVIPVAAQAAGAERENEQSIFDEIKRELELKNIRCELAIETGNVADEICKYAKEKDVDLIVVGHHEKGAIEQLFMGSVSQKVVHDSPTSVFVMK
jgi:nucleotide-binding universal stress UspA family protein